MVNNTNTSIQKKKWYQNTLAILGLLGALAGAVYGVMQILQSDLFKPKQVWENIEIVLDRSAAMAQSFNGGTKLDAAVSEIEKILSLQVANRDNLAFRQFGGPCEGNNTDLVVSFSQNNHRKVWQAMHGVHISGEASLAKAVLEATADFNDTERFGGVSKRIIVITGSGDSCYPKDVEEAVRRRMRGRTDKIVFRFIGIGVGGKEQEQLNKLAAATDGEVSLVTSKTELGGVLGKVVDLEPVITSANTIVNILNDVLVHLNKSIHEVNREDYRAAELRLEKARDEYKRTELPFRDLEKRQNREEFRSLYEIAKKNRELQSQSLQLSEIMIGRKRQGDIAGYNSSVKEMSDLGHLYNRNTLRITAILKQLRSL